MKNLKLLLLTIISVISLNLFSQVQVYTTNTTGPNTCDGTAVLDTTSNLSTIYWQGMGMIINQGSYYVNNLCPGTYSVSFVTNNTPVTLTFTITAGNFNPCLNFGGYITTIDSTINDGSMTVNIINGTAPYTYQWSNGNMLQSIYNLPVGGYCCYVMDANGCNTTLCDSITNQSVSVGDTLVINNTGSCNNPISTFTTTIEDCTINYATVDTAYISLISYPLSPFDSTMCVWNVVDTTGTMGVYATYYNGIDSTGCYNFQLVVYCYNKSMNYKTIVVNQTENIGFVGINELSGNSKQLVSVVDLMGKEVSIQPNKFLIYTYSDGSREIRYINE